MTIFIFILLTIIIFVLSLLLGTKLHRLVYYVTTKQPIPKSLILIMALLFITIVTIIFNCNTIIALLS